MHAIVDFFHISNINIPQTNPDNYPVINIAESDNFKAGELAQFMA
jgi:hypothetical protein